MPEHSYFNIEHIDQEYGHVFTILDDKLLVITKNKDNFECHIHELIQADRYDFSFEAIVRHKEILSVEVKKKKNLFNMETTEYTVYYSVGDKNVSVSNMDILDFEFGNDKASSVTKNQASVFVPIVSGKSDLIHSNQIEEVIEENSSFPDISLDDYNDWNTKNSATRPYQSSGLLTMDELVACRPKKIDTVGLLASLDVQRKSKRKFC